MTNIIRVLQLVMIIPWPRFDGDQPDRLAESISHDYRWADRMGCEVTKFAQQHGIATASWCRFRGWLAVGHQPFHRQPDPSGDPLPLTTRYIWQSNSIGKFVSNVPEGPLARSQASRL